MLRLTGDTLHHIPARGYTHESYLLVLAAGGVGGADYCEVDCTGEYRQIDLPNAGLRRAVTAGFLRGRNGTD